MIMTTYTEQELPGIRLATGDTDFPVTAIDINGAVDGDGVIWSVEATFENPLDAAAEAVFTLPLPVGAAVTGMTMKIGDREVAAEIKEREAARIEYEEAKDKGHSAAIVEQQRAEIFTITVGNIHPGEAISVVIEMHDRAAIDGIQASVRFPTMIKERYTPAGVPDASTITPPRRVGSSPLRATVTISFSEPAKDLICETVPSAQVTPTQVSITDFGLTGDIILHWTLPVAIAVAKWVADTDDKDMGTLEVNIRVDKDKKVVNRRKAVQVMLDRSGSMSGSNLEWAHRILDDLIASLTDNDLIHILAFDDQVDVLATTEHGFVPATRASKQALRKELASIRARGGTELTEAFEAGGAALAMLDDLEDSADIERIALIITDGAYGDEAAAVAHREKDLKGARVIAVAVGEDANGFLEVLAANGICVFVSSQQGLAEASAKVMSRIATAAHSKARLEAKGLTDQAPSHAPDIYPETIVTLSGRMPKPEPGDQVVVNADSGHVITLPITISTDASTTTRWASQHIKSLDYGMMSSDFAASGLDSHDALEKKIVEMSVKYKVLSKYTAWLAVDRSRTTDQVIVRTLVQPVYDNFSMDSMISYSLSTSFYALRAVPAANRPTIHSWAFESMQDRKSPSYFPRKNNSDLLQELRGLVDKIDVYFASTTPEEKEEALRDIGLGIMLLLSQFNTKVIGKRVSNKLQAALDKMFEHDFDSAETAELVSKVQAIVRAHSAYQAT